MISANDLRNTKLSPEQNGYSIDEVNAILNEAAETIEGYINENKELYRKMEILAKKIEEYREEENSIKTALITAQKMADKIQKESTETASLLVSKSEESAKKTLSEAGEKADKIVNEAREYASALLKEKTQEADSIVESAEKKANEAINSSKIVVQNILDQAKEISEDLIAKSKEEAQAYSILTESLKHNAKVFIDNLKTLYSEQFNALNNAELEPTYETKKQEEVDAIHNEVSSLVSEIDEIVNAIPKEVAVEEESVNDESENGKEERITEEEATEENAAEEVAEEENVIDDEIEIIDDDDENEDENEEPSEEMADGKFTITEDSEAAEDPMKAVEAFSQNEITPIDASNVIPEIDEEPVMEEAPDNKSLFEEDSSRLPFETYFNVSKDDAHLDRSQTISLIPPDEEDEDDAPKFRGFFKKKK